MNRLVSISLAAALADEGIFTASPGGGWSLPVAGG